MTLVFSRVTDYSTFTILLLYDTLSSLFIKNALSFIFLYLPVVMHSFYASCGNTCSAIIYTGHYTPMTQPYFNPHVLLSCFYLVYFISLPDVTDITTVILYVVTLFLWESPGFLPQCITMHVRQNGVCAPPVNWQFIQGGTVPSH